MFDRFGREISYLRVSVTDRCNLRCRYCMPPGGATRIRREDILSFEEIAAVVAAAVPLGITKIRLTGGEPLVRKGIVTLAGMIARIPGIADFGMTTNGTLLRDLAVPLKHAGLHRLNISLDALDPAHYREITRGGDVRLVLEGIEAARAAGFASIKINCVVNESGDEPDARAVAAFAREHGFPIRFIRRMVLESGAFWKVEGGEGGDCGRCNRLRMTSDGRLIPCLFNDLSFSVRELGVEKALRAAIEHKPPRGGQSRHCIGTLGG